MMRIDRSHVAVCRRLRNNVELARCVIITGDIATGIGSYFTFVLAKVMFVFNRFACNVVKGVVPLTPTPL